MGEEMKDNECFQFMERHIELLQETLQTATLMTDALRSRGLLKREPTAGDYDEEDRAVIVYADRGCGRWWVVVCYGVTVDAVSGRDFVVTDSDSAMEVVDCIEKLLMEERKGNGDDE